MVTAWVGFRPPPVAYAACGSPANTSAMPLAIISAPTTTAATNPTNPIWIATRRLMGTVGLVRNAVNVSTSVMMTRTRPPPANMRATDASNVVFHVEVRRYATPRLQRDQRGLERAGPREGAEQHHPCAVAQAQKRCDPNDRDQSQAERQPESRRLAQRQRSLPGTAADEENRKVNQSADQ